MLLMITTQGNMLRWLLLVLIVVSGCQSLPAQHNPEESDRGKARLIGPVATVKVESTYLNGKMINGWNRNVRFTKNLYMTNPEDS